MAIDPRLVSIKKVADIPTVPLSELQTGKMFGYTGDGDLKKVATNDLLGFIKSGIKGIATQANAPTPYDAVTYPNGLFETYQVRVPLTMPNSWGSAVTQLELDNNFVYFDVKNGVVSKEVSLKPMVSVENIVNPLETTKAVSGKAVSDYVNPLLSKKADLTTVFKASGKNIINPNDVVTGVRINNLTGEIITLAGGVVSGKIPVKGGVEYKRTASGAGLERVIFYDALGTKLKPVNASGTPQASYQVTKSFALFSPATAVSMQIELRVDASDDLWATTYQIEEGSVATAYEPYIPKIADKDLILKDYYKKTDVDSKVKTLENKVFSVKSKNLFNFEDVLTGTIDINTGVYVSNASRILSNLIPIEAGQVYIRSGWAISTPLVRFLDINGNPLKPLNLDNTEYTNYSITNVNPLKAPPTAKFLQFQLFATTGTGWENAQLEKGSTPTVYVKFKPLISSLDIEGGGSGGVGQSGFPNIIVASSDAVQSVKDIADYVCDGIDDQVEINNAINYLFNRGGGKVFLPKGLYIISAGIYTRDKISIEGSGWSTVIKVKDGLVLDGFYPMIGNSFDNEGATVKHLKLDGNKSNITSSNANNLKILPIYFRNAKDVLVEGVYAINSSGTGLYAYGGTRITYVNNFSSNNVGHGMATTEFTQDFIYSGNQCFDNSQQGIHTSTGRGLVNGNICTNNTDGISGTNATDSVYTNNVCRNNRNSGFLCNGGGKVVSNNVFSDNGYEGIYLEATGGISNVIISNNLIQRNGRNGINCEKVFDITISNNIIGAVPSGYNGIKLTDKVTSGAIFIRGNQITGAGTAKSISLSTGYDNLQIVDNSAPNGIEYDLAAVKKVIRDNF